MVFLVLLTSSSTTLLSVNKVDNLVYKYAGPTFALCTLRDRQRFEFVECDCETHNCVLRALVPCASLRCALLGAAWCGVG